VTVVLRLEHLRLRRTLRTSGSPSTDAAGSAFIRRVRGRLAAALGTLLGALGPPLGAIGRRGFTFGCAQLGVTNRASGVLRGCPLLSRSRAPVGLRPTR
jgi:hypothetical protein